MNDRNPRGAEPGPEVRVVADPDASRAGRAVRVLSDAGERVAGYVGDPDDTACAEFRADVIVGTDDQPRSSA